MQSMQMDQLRAAMEAQQQARLEARQAAEARNRYLGSVDPSQGPAMPVSPAAALSAGLSPQELSLIAPAAKDKKPHILKPGEVAFDDAGRQLFNVPDKADKPPADWQLYQLSGAADRGMSFDQWDQARRRAGASNVNVSTGDRIPPSLIKAQDELIDKLSVARSTDADLGAIAAQIQKGELKFGPIRNLVNTGKNIAGVSDEESRAFGTFKSTLEKLRNDSLRLNTGVQTEGDAQRAWNELFQNINDTAFVGQRLQEIRKINQRAAQLHDYRLNVLRQNSGAGPLPQPPISPALGDGAPKVRRYNPETGRIE